MKTFNLNITFTRPDENNAIVYEIGMCIDAETLHLAIEECKARNAHVTLKSIKLFAVVKEDGVFEHHVPILKEVRKRISADTHSVKNGVFTVRRGFFYTNGYTAEMYVDHVLSTFPTATIVDCGEVWKNFRGGASVAQQSHWFVKFTFEGSK